MALIKLGLLREILFTNPSFRQKRNHFISRIISVLRSLKMKILIECLHLPQVIKALIHSNSLGTPQIILNFWSPLFLYWCFSSESTRAKSPALRAVSSPASSTRAPSLDNIDHVKDILADLQWHLGQFAIQCWIICICSAIDLTLLHLLADTGCS